MHFQTKCVVLIASFYLPSFCVCLQFQLHGLDIKVSGVFDKVQGLSLSQCAAYSEIKENSKSLNYNENGKICELSNMTPDGSLIGSTGWKVYVSLAESKTSTTYSTSSALTTRESTETSIKASETTTAITLPETTTIEEIQAETTMTAETTTNIIEESTIDTTTVGGSTVGIVDSNGGGSEGCKHDEVCTYEEFSGIIQLCVRDSGCMKFCKCNQFMEASNIVFRWVEFDCGTGLVFNEELNVCDWPQ